MNAPDLVGFKTIFDLSKPWKYFQAENINQIPWYLIGISN